MKKKDLSVCDKSWSLFLDRDGVINERLLDDYIKNTDEFKFIDGTIEAIKGFSNIFGKIFVVTNQQGIGKGLMTEKTLNDIHKKMSDEIKQHGGKIDKVYYCPFKKEDKSFLRKPNVGMGLLAKKEFPEINFKKSIMAGDTISDMEFGKKLKMITVFISNDKALIDKNSNLIDFGYPNLLEFYKSFNKQ